MNSSQGSSNKTVLLHVAILIALAALAPKGTHILEKLSHREAGKWLIGFPRDKPPVSQTIPNSTSPAASKESKDILL